VNVTPLALHSARAVRETLLAHGWEAGAAETAAGGIEPAAVHLTELDQGTLEALVLYCGRIGLDVLTGDDWAILAGSRSRLSALARPWVVPPALSQVATCVGLALPADTPPLWQTARGPVALDRPLLMGILNVTPDSFSDGGALGSVSEVLARAERLVRDGAAILDVGGESTRPGRTTPVPVDEELTRVLPAVAALAREFPDMPLSIDTVKSAIAAAALDAGAAIVNDVGGFRLDPEMVAVAARARAGVVLMHSRGSITEISSYAHADYGTDVIGRVVGELGAAVDGAIGAGVAPEAIVVDPGLGFSKTVAQNIFVLDQLAAFRRLGRPLLVGPSRKRFLGEVSGRAVQERDLVTAVACALAFERGAMIYRVHDVAAARDALALAFALSPMP
jgi:dihydropteroate synthase